MENTSQPSTPQPRTPLEERFAHHIADCFLGAIDRIAEDEELTTDRIIEKLFADEEYLCALIGQSIEEFEARYAEHPPGEELASP